MIISFECSECGNCYTTKGSLTKHARKANCSAEWIQQRAAEANECHCTSKRAWWARNQAYDRPAKSARASETISPSSSGAFASKSQRVDQERARSPPQRPHDNAYSVAGGTPRTPCIRSHERKGTHDRSNSYSGDDMQHTEVIFCKRDFFCYQRKLLATCGRVLPFPPTE